MPHIHLLIHSLQWQLKLQWLSEMERPDFCAVDTGFQKCYVVFEQLKLSLGHSALVKTSVSGFFQGHYPVRVGSLSLGSDGSGTWSKEEGTLQVSTLEMRGVLALSILQECLMGQAITLIIDIATVMKYLNEQGGTVSHSFCHLTLLIVT